MGWGTEDEFEIDLTADAPGGLLPIRWVGPSHHNGNGDSSGNGNGGHNGPEATVRTRPHPVPRVVTLASFMGQPVAPREPAPVLTLREPDEWRELQPITLRDVATSRGARFLAVVVATVFLVLIMATVMLWQEVEERDGGAATQPAVTGFASEDLVEVKNRLNSIETALGSLLDDTGTVVTAPTPSVLEYKVAALRACIIEFQHAIDAGRIRGGQFPYC